MTVAPTTDAPVATGLWSIEVLERAPGLTRVTRGGGGATVRVGDRHGDLAAHPASTGGRRMRSLLAARLADDGSVVVVTRSAPPALLVTASGARLLPVAPARSERTSLAIGDLLLLCSAAVLDEAPAGLVRLLATGPAKALDRDSQSLLHDLLRDAPSGAAAAVRRLAAPAAAPSRGWT